MDALAKRCDPAHETSMFAIFESILPIFILISAGQILRRLPLIRDEGWQGLDQLGFWFLYPALLFSSIFKADFSGLSIGPMLFALMGSVFLFGALISLPPCCCRCLPTPLCSPATPRPPAPCSIGCSRSAIDWRGAACRPMARSPIGSRHSNRCSGAPCGRAGPRRLATDQPQVPCTGLESSLDLRCREPCGGRKLGRAG